MTNSKPTKVKATELLYREYKEQDDLVELINDRFNFYRTEFTLLTTQDDADYYVVGAHKTGIFGRRIVSGHILNGNMLLGELFIFKKEDIKRVDTYKRTV